MINETEGKKKKSDPIISQNYNLKKNTLPNKAKINPFIMLKVKLSKVEHQNTLIIFFAGLSRETLSRKW